MRRFLNKLMSDFRETSAARTARRAPRRASLQVEGLEDRLVLSTATIYRVTLPPPPLSTVTPQGPTLVVDALPGSVTFETGGLFPLPVPHVRQITFQADPHKPSELDVLDNGTLIPGGQVPIASVKNVLVNVAGLDTVNVDDSKGLPFVVGTTVALSGSGLLNSFNLTGSRTVSGDESYVEGVTADQASSLALGGVTFQLNSTIGSVTDSVKITGKLYVSAIGQKVSLSGSDGRTQTLYGLGPSGGSVLTYGNKNSVVLYQNAANANVSLNATAAAAGEQSFYLVLTALGDTANISGTPSTVTTNVWLYDSGQWVGLGANSGPVNIAGDSWSSATAAVYLGESLPQGGTTTGGIHADSVVISGHVAMTTAGIQANVNISQVPALIVDDSGNVTTQEHVTVSSAAADSMTISGTGLFGNGQVKVTDVYDFDEPKTLYDPSGPEEAEDGGWIYFQPIVSIRTGQLADTYSVAATARYAFDNFAINIDDYSKVGLSVMVSEATAGTTLHLILNNTFVARMRSRVDLALGIAQGGLDINR
jgi:hypothetical protein